MVRVEVVVSSQTLFRMESQSCLCNAARQFLIDGAYAGRYVDHRIPQKPNVDFWDSHRRHKFGNWLFAQNAVLVRTSGHYHLEFFSEEDRTLFLLRWS